MSRDVSLEHRFPLVTESGRRLLQRLEEHPHVPRFTHPGFDRLSAAGLARAREYALQIQSEPPRWRSGEVPAWLEAFADNCYRDVPLYRREGPRPARFIDIPPLDRGDLNREPWSFVPDSQSLEDLIIYNTSGATGHPLDILTHPDTLALYLPLLRAVLARYGVTLEGGPDRVAVMLVCSQRHTYTYAAISPLLDQGAFVKINLDPGSWRNPGDAAQFIDACAPEVFTGDPLAFSELARLSLRHKPRALISTAMTLTAGLKQRLESHFGCPVIDVYAMNETGPIALAGPGGASYQLLQPHLYVEILDRAGRPCPPTVRGEVAVSGGFNPFLPLLRYRTGDFAALEWRGSQPWLVGLEGRPPVIFRAADGRALNNVDISIALRPFTLAQYTLHQNADGSLRLRLLGAEDREAIRSTLIDLFGAGAELHLEELALPGPGADKVIQYSSDLTSGP